MLRRDPLANPEALIRRVYSYVAYRIGDGPDAEDVTSETFERALRYRASFDARKGEPTSWLIGIARRCIADAVTRPVEAREEQETAESSDLAEDTVRRLSIRSGLAELDERSAELIALRYGADLSARQIGVLLDMQPNAVDVALHRALGRLRAILETEPDDQALPVAREARSS